MKANTRMKAACWIEAMTLGALLILGCDSHPGRWSLDLWGRSSEIPAFEVPGFNGLNECMKYGFEFLRNPGDLKDHDIRNFTCGLGCRAGRCDRWYTQIGV